MKYSVTHRAIYPQEKLALINGAQIGFSTGLSGYRSWLSLRWRLISSQKKPPLKGGWLVRDQVVCYLPMQKLEKIRPNKSSELKAPVISPSTCCA